MGMVFDLYNGMRRIRNSSLILKIPQDADEDHDENKLRLDSKIIVLCISETPRRDYIFQLEEMKSNKSSIFELEIDALRYVMVCLGNSGDGYADLARGTSVCQEFKELVEEEEVLKSVAFETSFVHDQHGSFWNLNGLLTKCARVENKTACYLLIRRVREQLKSNDMMINSFNLAVKDFHDKTSAVKGTSARSEETALAWEMKITLGLRIDLAIVAHCISLKGVRTVAGQMGHLGLQRRPFYSYPNSGHIAMKGLSKIREKDEDGRTSVTGKKLIYDPQGLSTNKSSGNSGSNDTHRRNAYRGQGPKFHPSDKAQSRGKRERVGQSDRVTGQWTPEEDRRLISFVNMHENEVRWGPIADMLGGRSRKQCRERWMNYLKPGIKTDEFTLDEEKMLVAFHQKFGTKWATIARHMPGRTESKIKNEFYGSKRRMLARGNTPVTHLDRYIRNCVLDSPNADIPEDQSFGPFVELVGPSSGSAQEDLMPPEDNDQMAVPLPTEEEVFPEEEKSLGPIVSVKNVSTAPNYHMEFNLEDDEEFLRLMGWY